MMMKQPETALKRCSKCNLLYMPADDSGGMCPHCRAGQSSWGTVFVKHEYARPVKEVTVRMHICPFCGKLAHSEYPYCPHCGNYVDGVPVRK